MDLNQGYEGLIQTHQNGWQQQNGSWYYYENGVLLKSRWLKEGGYWYWLGEDGKMATGWLSREGKFYWLNPTRAGSLPSGALIITDSNGALMDGPA